MEVTNKNIINDLVGEFKSLISPKIILSFDALDTAVYDLAGASNSEQKQNRYFDQLESIKNQQENLIDVFMQSIERANNKFCNGNYNYVGDVEIEQETPALSLSLVEENTLDEFLARDNLISKCELNCNTNLYGLEQRYAKLASVAQLKTSQVPISPIVIVDSYRKTIEAIVTKFDMDMHFRLMLYITFDRNVLKTLNEVYNDVNNFLASKGVIEQISFGFKTNAKVKEKNLNEPIENLSLLDEKVETINPNEKPTLNDLDNVDQANVKDVDNSYQRIANLLKSNKNKQQLANNNLDNSSSNHNTQQTVDVSTKLLEQFNQQIKNITHSSDLVTNQNSNLDQTPKDPVDVGALLKTLNSLQDINFSKINLSEKNISPEEIKTEFINELGEDSVEDIENKDMQAIDLVVLLFKYIVDDRNLPETIQVILSHLQIPYLKIALQDHNLFADKSHPARLLLNELSVASVGWSNEVDEDGSYLNKIKSISQKVVNNEEYSNDYFIDLINEFKKFNNDFIESSRETESQTSEKLHKKEKLVQAKKRAAEVLINKMTNKKMPKLFKDILLGSWLYIIVLTDIKETRMSDIYKEKVDFIDKLTALAHFSEEITITKSQIDELLKDYIRGLKLVTFNKEIIKQKIVVLKRKLVDIHFNLDFESNDSETESQEIISLAEIQNHELGVVSYIEEEALTNTSENIEVDVEALDIVKSMATGDWLTFNDLDDNGQIIKAKLSWISPITGKYLFVLASGVKYKDIIPQTIAIGLTEKTILRIDSQPLFDRAMESIADTLQASG